MMASRVLDFLLRGILFSVAIISPMNSVGTFSLQYKFSSVPWLCHGHDQNVYRSLHGMRIRVGRVDSLSLAVQSMVNP